METGIPWGSANPTVLLYQGSLSDCLEKACYKDFSGFERNHLMRKIVVLLLTGDKYPNSR